MVVRAILVAIDGSIPSRRAARFAAELASTVGSPLVLAHVRVPTPYPGERSWGPFVEVERAGVRQGEALLRQMASELAGEGLEIRMRLLRGEAAESIAAAAEDDDIELVVVGTRGLGAVARMLVGSVANRVMHICTKPVLVVP